MKRADLVQPLAYVLVSILSVGGAFLISLKFVGHTHAQGQSAQPKTAQHAPTQGQSSAAQHAPTQGQMPQQGQPVQTQTSADDGAPADAAAANPGATADGQAAPQGDESEATKDAEASAQVTNAGISELEGFLEPFIYDIVNRRDPFQPYSEYVPQDESPSNRPISPAQRFDLDQLKLVGVMWDVKDPKAMFTDPAQEVLVLGRDESIGNKNGYIAAIREGEVVVVEAIRKRGDIIYRTRVLRIER